MSERQFNVVIDGETNRALGILAAYRQCTKKDLVTRAINDVLLEYPEVTRMLVADQRERLGLPASDAA
jgi:hypothetical protein